jgi:hypothetical protein
MSYERRREAHIHGGHLEWCWVIYRAWRENGVLMGRWDHA